MSHILMDLLMSHFVEQMKHSTDRFYYSQTLRFAIMCHSIGNCIANKRTLTRYCVINVTFMVQRSQPSKLCIKLKFLWISCRWHMSQLRSILVNIVYTLCFHFRLIANVSNTVRNAFTDMLLTTFYLFYAGEMCERTNVRCGNHHMF